MHTLSNNDRSIGYGETSGQSGDFADSDKEYFQKLIKRANSVPITKVFKSYGFRINEQDKKIICPFKNHKGGRESTPSMNYFPQTNSFFCYGCKVGGGCCSFVAEMDGTTKSKAAYKILNNFQLDAVEEAEINNQNFSEKLEIMIDFSNSIRDFRFDCHSKESQDFIKKICIVYDGMCFKHDLDNAALQFLVNSLKKKIEEYKSDFNSW